MINHFYIFMKFKNNMDIQYFGYLIYTCYKIFIFKKPSATEKARPTCLDAISLRSKKKIIIKKKMP